MIKDILPKIQSILSNKDTTISRVSATSCTLELDEKLDEIALCEYMGADSYCQWLA